MTQVTLFTKPGCHLCEEVEAVISGVAKRRPFELIIRNIVENADDFDRYQYLIPVVQVDGNEIAQYELTEEQFEAALNAAR
jgi:glutaredoxin